MPLAVYALKLLGLTALYFVSAQIGLFVAVFYGDVSPLWPPSGLAIAIFWLFGWRWWPMIILGDLAIAYHLDQSLGAGVWGGITQLLEAGVAMAFIRFLQIQPSLKSFRDTLWFFGTIAILSPAISGALGAINLFLQNEITQSQLVQTAITWWLGDTLGILVITPLITCWWGQHLPLKLFTERWVLTTLIISAIFLGLFSFVPAHTSLLFFLLMPYVIYSAIYLGNQGASLSLAVMTCLVLGEGFFFPGTDFSFAVKMAFIGTCAISGFFVAALVYENNRSQFALTREKQKVQTTLESISDGVISTDLQGKVLFLNPMAEHITGWTAQAALGCDILEVCPLFESNQGHGVNPVSVFLSRTTKEVDHYIYRFPNRKSELRVIDARIKQWKQTGKVAGTVIVLRDITDENFLKEELTYQAHHDEITGLPNRRAFIQALKQTLSNNQGQQKFALIYIDLDQFKLINDTCGHEIGDLMLIEIAQLVSKPVKDPGIAARISGDEFGLILPIDNEPHAQAIAESIRSSILHYRFHHEDLVFSVGASIGLTYIHPKDTSANAVLSRADIACYQAKETGHNKISTYHAEDVEMLRYQSEIEWISQLKRALMRDEFILYRQGIHHLNQVDPCNHYEILIRLKQNGRVISPGSFLPIAERFGFMPVIDRWVTEKTFQHLHDNPDDNALYNINLCGNSLNDKNFFEDIKALATQKAINTAQICFEVTERVALQDIDEISQAMNEMIDLGFKFALDDFGSGVASHAYLEQLPIQYVKLDGRFVRTLADNKTSQIIIESLAKIAQLKNIKCIAEWIENEDIIATLRHTGIEYGQGYFFDKPGPIAKKKSENMKKLSNSR